MRATQGTLRGLSNERGNTARARNDDYDEEKDEEDESDVGGAGSGAEPTSIAAHRRPKAKKSFLKALWPFHR